MHPFSCSYRSYLFSHQLNISENNFLLLSEYFSTVIDWFPPFRSFLIFFLIQLCPSRKKPSFSPSSLFPPNPELNQSTSLIPFFISSVWASLLSNAIKLMLYISDICSMVLSAHALYLSFKVYSNTTEKPRLYFFPPRPQALLLLSVPPIFKRIFCLIGKYLLIFTQHTADNTVFFFFSSFLPEGREILDAFQLKIRFGFSLFFSPFPLSL